MMSTLHNVGRRRRDPTLHNVGRPIITLDADVVVLLPFITFDADVVVLLPFITLDADVVVLLPFITLGSSLGTLICSAQNIRDCFTSMVFASADPPVWASDTGDERHRYLQGRCGTRQKLFPRYEYVVKRMISKNLVFYGEIFSFDCYVGRSCSIS